MITSARINITNLKICSWLMILWRAEGFINQRGKMRYLMDDDISWWRIIINFRCLLFGKVTLCSFRLPIMLGHPLLRALQYFCLEAQVKISVRRKLYPVSMICTTDGAIQIHLWATYPPHLHPTTRGCSLLPSLSLVLSSRRNLQTYCSGRCFRKEIEVKDQGEDHKAEMRGLEFLGFFRPLSLN